MFEVTLTYKSGLPDPLYDFDKRLMELATEYAHGKFKPGSDTFELNNTERRLTFVFKKQYNAETFGRFVSAEALRRSVPVAIEQSRSKVDGG